MTPDEIRDAVEQIQEHLFPDGPWVAMTEAETAQMRTMWAAAENVAQGRVSPANWRAYRAMMSAPVARQRARVGAGRPVALRDIEGEAGSTTEIRVLGRGNRRRTATRSS